MKEQFDKVCNRCSKLITNTYSTSFSIGIRCLHKSLRDSIYSIYGFVRLADEIVDTLHDYPKTELLNEFKKETYLAIKRKISLNPVLNSFQNVVNRYEIPIELIDNFFNSMEMDLNKITHNPASYKNYILGSAEVVGLMCLKVFVNGDEKKFIELKDYAMKLGSAFQKINFLRDLKDDYFVLGRVYFPNVEMTKFDDVIKKQLEIDIEKDFREALNGIKLLPKYARFGVYLAYEYYYKLFLKIKSLSAQVILTKRVRIPDYYKYALFFTSYLKHKLGLIY